MICESAVPHVFAEVRTFESWFVFTSFLQTRNRPKTTATRHGSISLCFLASLQAISDTPLGVELVWELQEFQELASLLLWRNTPLAKYKLEKVISKDEIASRKSRRQTVRSSCTDEFYFIYKWHLTFNWVNRPLLFLFICLRRCLDSWVLLELHPNHLTSLIRCWVSRYMYYCCCSYSWFSWQALEWDLGPIYQKTFGSFLDLTPSWELTVRNECLL